MLIIEQFWRVIYSQLIGWGFTLSLMSSESDPWAGDDNTEKKSFSILNCCHSFTNLPVFSGTVALCSIKEGILIYRTFFSLACEFLTLPTVTK